MGKRPSVLSIKIPEKRYFFNPMSKKPTSIVIPKNILLTGSPLSSPTKSDEAFEKEINRSKKEFNQFNKDLDEIANSMEKLYEDSPEWFINVQEIKKKQDNVEECILATQDKIMENEMSLVKLKTFQDEIHEDINNDLKKIQDQIYELLEKHRITRLKISNISDDQSRTSEQLDIILQSIHEYARLIEEASLTIKTHFDDDGSTIDYKSYESLDLSPFRKHEASQSYFEEQIYNKNNNKGDGSDKNIEYYHHHQYYEHQEITTTTTTTTNIIKSKENSPLTATYTSETTPTTRGGKGCSKDDEENKSQETDQEKNQQQPIHPLPRYQIKHQKLLLMSMRRAAVGLKFLLYANQLNDYKNGFPHSECDLDLDLDYNEDSSTTQEVITTTTYREVIHDKDTVINTNNYNSGSSSTSSSSSNGIGIGDVSSSSSSSSNNNNNNSRCGIGCLNSNISSSNNSSSSSCTSSDSGSDSSNNDDNNEKNKDIGAGKICVTIRKRSLIVHSYDLLRFDKRMLVKQKN